MKIIAGDWKEGSYVVVQKSIFGKWEKLLLSSGGFKHDKMPIAEITAFNIVTEDNKASVLGKVGWGAVGAVALGPLGLLAGVLAGGPPPSSRRPYERPCPPDRRDGFPPRRGRRTAAGVRAA